MAITKTAIGLLSGESKLPVKTAAALALGATIISTVILGKLANEIDKPKAFSCDFTTSQYIKAGTRIETIVTGSRYGGLSSREKRIITLLIYGLNPDAFTDQGKAIKETSIEIPYNCHS